MADKFDRGLERLKSFYQAHQSDPRLVESYGYFFAHPFTPINLKRLRAIIDFSASHKSSPRLFDACCGGGLISLMLSMMGASVVGVDANEDEIAVAQMARNELGLTSVEFQCGDAVKVIGAAPPQSFDQVLFAYAIHHVPQYHDLMANAFNALKDDGRLIVNEENRSSPVFRLKHVLRGVIQRDTDDEHQLSFSELTLLHQQTGFRIESAVGIDVVPLPMRYQWCLVMESCKTP
ncbi:MAG: methyltransferase domain-containing protein [Elusimicrobia bacterium]|nr:methyltransferase domain-containing protein [Elusimicrobiota bacterium]